MTVKIIHVWRTDDFAINPAVGPHRFTRGVLVVDNREDHDLIRWAEAHADFVVLYDRGAA